MKKIIAVSSCLLGNTVRYDGQSKKNEYVCKLAEDYELVAFCPEISIGMGVPRPPVQLVELHATIHARGVNNPEHDVTDLLSTFAQQYNLAKVSGVIFKARSPSCGLNSTPLYNPDNILLRNTSGIFAAVLASRWPSVPMIEETDLEDNEKSTAFLLQVQKLC